MGLTKTILILLMLWTGGCGIKGDPLPPAEQETLQKEEVTPTAIPLTPAEAKEEKKKVKK